MKKIFVTIGVVLLFYPLANAEERRIDIHNEDILLVDSNILIEDVHPRIINPDDLKNEPQSGLYVPGLKIRFLLRDAGLASGIVITSMKDVDTSTEIKLSLTNPNTPMSGQTRSKYVEFHWRPKFNLIDTGESKTFFLKLNEDYLISVLATRRFGQLPNGARGNYLDFDKRTFTLRKLKH